MNTENLKDALSHVLWLGGGTDSGKTTVSRQLAERHGLQLYNYDSRDLPQTQQLAETDPHYAKALTRSAEDSWMKPTPQELTQRSLKHMDDRFPLVLDELLTQPKTPLILAEGFGLTPNLLHPLLSNMRQAIWLVPNKTFKQASMKRRNKPSWRDQVSDPDLATHNFYTRDMLLSAHFRQTATAHDLRVHEVDGTQSVAEIATLLEQHFGLAPA